MARLSFGSICGPTLLLIAATSSALAEDSSIIPTEALKTIYLNCEKAALSGAIASGDIAFCSVVYEDLKRRTFNGDFRALLRWYQWEVAQDVPSS